jgi:maltooligosyltrehalose synthase
MPLGDVWGDALLQIHGSWRNVFAEELISGDFVTLKSVFGRFPVAILERA